MATAGITVLRGAGDITGYSEQLSLYYGGAFFHAGNSLFLGGCLYPFARYRVAILA